ncbi:hypothetical protein [Mycobacteroides abscessus]|uniref:hypothetical protein n=1 Tax=Mycobacteroides abscessus TaxID=36809 RepID=UPI00092B0558|nr:hypothetical protein [Mycobacteroides abscessus]SHY09980.1 Uncharacterised protein [Mycobacteroides abscessus subsp. abscessus]SID57092.1 Uncharacterised protein [Mycobacteroides abscessus subsp. abscessus]SKO43078.1 Uncharacterised protein [Mycobacteroides abscessus subsp. abscessus]SLJ20969.1 Uncharacterised protein [Mycobacteroides abscessus subsp. abscessus]SLJ23744.1 Uncharacterised protein [Mycobacteroides abscessus subsp. abscessus]
MTKEDVRKWFYVASAVVGSIVAVLVTAKVIDEGTAASVTDLIKMVGGLLGVAVPATAGVVLHKQIKNAPGAAADKAVTSLQDIQAQLNSTAQAAQDQLAAATQVAVDSITKIQATVGNVVGPQVSLGPLAAEVIKSVTE